MEIFLRDTWFCDNPLDILSEKFILFLTKDKGMIAKNIQDRINTQGKGWIFSAMDFADMANRNAIDQTLSRLSKKGAIRKLATGLYDTPRVSQRFGALPPDLDSVAKAIAKKFGYHAQVTPAQAAHDLGLSLQVPTQPVYLTNGLSKAIKIGNQSLRFIRVSHKKMVGVGTKSGLVIQALYYFGQGKLDDSTIIARIRALLNDKDKDALRLLMPRTPLWMQPTLRKILQDA
jgi:hypothetical protein